MKKIIFSTIVSVMIFQALTVLADDPSSTHSKKEKDPVDLVCMQNAVVKRDNSVITSVGTYSSDVKRLLETRRDALRAAWIITDKKARKEALKTAWRGYDSNYKNTRKAFKKSKDGAWEMFRADRKVCRDRDNDEEKSASHDDM